MGRIVVQSNVLGLIDPRDMFLTVKQRFLHMRLLLSPDELINNVLDFVQYIYRDIHNNILKNKQQQR